MSNAAVLSTTAAPSPALESLVATVSGAGDLDGKVGVLLTGLAALIKATSNDQNVQRLSRDLRAAAPALAGALVGSAAKAA